MTVLVSQAGQTLDDIVYEVFGDNPHMLEDITTLNPHALKYGTHLPAGIFIELPELTPPLGLRQTINLWD
jgi:phage tail protein X